MNDDFERWAYEDLVASNENLTGLDLWKAACAWQREQYDIHLAKLMDQFGFRLQEIVE